MKTNNVYRYLRTLTSTLSVQLLHPENGAERACYHPAKYKYPVYPEFHNLQQPFSYKSCIFRVRWGPVEVEEIAARFITEESEGLAGICQWGSKIYGGIISFDSHLPVDIQNGESGGFVHEQRVERQVWMGRVSHLRPFAQPFGLRRHLLLVERAEK